jgi:hypothetical protein
LASAGKTDWRVLAGARHAGGVGRDAKWDAKRRDARAPGPIESYDWY